jgi:hypothetical protein
MTKSESMLDLRAAARTPPYMRRRRPTLPKLEEDENPGNQNGSNEGSDFDYDNVEKLLIMKIDYGKY